MSTQIYNTELFKELKDGAKVQQLTSVIPNQLAEKVVPVMEVNPKLLKRATIIANKSQSSTTTGATVLTTPLGRDLFITGINVSNSQSVLSDNVVIALNTTIDGKTSQPLYYRTKETLTAGSFFDNVVFSSPVKIDQGVNILFVGVFTAGTCVSNITLFGYYTDGTNA
jgi:hypothetical protein